MPGPAHETLLVLLRDHPDWLRTLVRVLAQRELPDGLTAADATVRVVDPAELRPDLAFLSSDGPEWLLLEAQLEADDQKARSWTLSAAALWCQRAAPGDLVVITASKAVGAWAKRVCRMDGPFGTRLMLTPIVLVLTEQTAERLLDPEHPELAFFAAWAMQARHGPKARRVVERAVEMVDLIPDEALRSRLVRSIMDVLNERMVKALKELAMNPENRFPGNPAMRKLLEEWTARFGPELEAKGEAKGKAEAVLLVLSKRGLSVDAQSRARVLACRDVLQLDRWLDRALTARSVLDLFEGEEPS
jgi:hypothetical protein